MFHMLGRFAFTSFFSSRSSRGFSTESSRFWFCCCDSVLPNAFTIFIPTRPSFANQSCSLAPSGGFSTQHLYGAVLAQSHARGARRFFAPAPLTTRAKLWHAREAC